jgi:hypothetical protein
MGRESQTALERLSMKKDKKYNDKNTTTRNRKVYTKRK